MSNISRCRIRKGERQGYNMLLITNKKSHKPFQISQNASTFDDLDTLITAKIIMQVGETFSS